MVSPGRSAAWAAAGLAFASAACTAFWLAGGTAGLDTVAAALALAGLAGTEPSDEYALRWHVFFWDPWFLVWGVALALGAHARR